MPDATRILVQLHHANPVIERGLRAVLSDEPDLELQPPASARGSAPQVVVADQGHALARLRSPAAHERVLVVDSVRRGWPVRDALQAGACGYVRADGPLHELLQAVRTVGRGGRHLCPAASRAMADCFAVGAVTARELDVLRLLGRGLDNKSISRELDIALSTVKVHVQALLDKMQATSRTGAAIAAVRLGLIEVDAAPGRIGHPA